MWVAFGFPSGAAQALTSCGLGDIIELDVLLNMICLNVASTNTGGECNSKTRIS